MIPPRSSSCVVTIVVRADDSVWARVIGALDLDAEDALAGTVTRLGELAPPSVVLDFTGVTFAGASLSHFLIRLRRTVPDAPILMQHASPGTRLVMMVTGTDRLVVQDEELPWNAG